MHLAHEDGCDHNRTRYQSRCIILKTAEPCSIKHECEQHDGRGGTDDSSASLVDVGAVSSGQPNGGCGKYKEFAQCMSFRNTHATNAYLAVHEHFDGNNPGNDHCEPVQPRAPGRAAKCCVLCCTPDCRISLPIDAFTPQRLPSG